MRSLTKLAMLAGITACELQSQDAVMTSLRAVRDVAPDTDPNSDFWRNAPRVIAERDAFGNLVPRHRTEIRSRWTPENLYFLFICHYEQLYLKPNPTTGAETNELWKWDVAEVFLGSDFQDIRRCEEFEVSPQGEWVDLDIDLHKPHHEDGWMWNSGFRVAAQIDRSAKIWYGAMRIPFAALVSQAVHPGVEFRVNLYRGQGPQSGWKGIAWQPMMSKTFHVPERFGLLKLVD